MSRDYSRYIPRIQPVAFFFILGACLCPLANAATGGFDATTRPGLDTGVFDYAGIMPDAQEYVQNYLQQIREQQGVEIAIVCVPTLSGYYSIEELATAVLNNWQVGAQCGGRGVVMVFVEEGKQVRLEVSYELEDVFTDMFCGAVQDTQLKPYYFNGQPGVGLVSVIELLEERARIKQEQNYTAGQIEALDHALLSGGAGAGRDLSRLMPEPDSEAARLYPAGTTPEQAWQTLIRSWSNKIRDPNLGVYTALTRLIYRDYRNLPDARYEKDVRTYAYKQYEILQSGDYAVVFFGNKTGWENSPFLLCNDGSGWKFDIVHQRRYIRMGRNPAWGIERSNHPYVDLLKDCPYWQRQDIPLEGADRYAIVDDVRVAREILAAEERMHEHPEDYESVMNVGRLYAVTSMGPKTISILEKAKKLNPTAAQPHKYLAIAHVDAHYQYKAACEELLQYVQKAPDDVFGHNFLGYVYLCLEKHDEAVKALKTAIALRPDNCYAYCQAARVYAQLYRRAPLWDTRRTYYKTMKDDMIAAAQSTATPDGRRIRWLETELSGIQ
ncbi:MAG: TPM domain-containing protein [Candidatus Omnitrophica bacterium]|nr:TPM domain-containing protein [Candidatus Omnitrophota bacterium]